MPATNIADQLCPVCHEEHKTPVILTCKQQHVLCLSCARLKALAAHAKGQLISEAAIKRLLAKDDTGEAVETEKKDELANEDCDTFICPVCGEAVAYDLGKHTLGLSVKAAAIVSGDADTGTGGTSKEPAVCGNCKSRVVDGQNSHCSECSAVAHKHAKMKSHTIEPHSSLTKPKDSTALCAEHNKPLDMTCVKDKVPVCAGCLSDGPHREQVGDDWIPHECQSIAEAVKTVTEDLQAVLVRCETHQRAVEESHAAVAQTAGLLYTSYCDARASVEAYFADIILRLERVREEKLKEVDAVYQQQHALYESQISLLGSACVAVRETLSIGRRVLNSEETEGVIQLQQRQSAVSALEEATSLCRDKLMPVTRGVELTGLDNAKFIEHTLREVSCYGGGIHQLRVRPNSQSSSAECPFSAVVDAYGAHGEWITDVVSGAAAISAVAVYAQLSGDGGVRCDLSVVRERDSFVVRWPSSSGIRDGRWQVYYVVNGSAPQLLTDFQYGTVKYSFHPRADDNGATLSVSADGLTVRHQGPHGPRSVLGSLLPNNGRHTWRLRMSIEGDNPFQTAMFGVSRRQTDRPSECYTWSVCGLWTRGDGEVHRFNPVCTFPKTAATHEVELTLDSDQHTLTMRRLDNGQTDTIDNIPQNVYVYVFMMNYGNAATFV